MKEVNKEFDAKMQSIDVVMSDFASVRAGRANAAVLGPDHRGLLRCSHASEPGSGYLLPRPQEPDDPALG